MRSTRLPRASALSLFLLLTLLCGAARADVLTTLRDRYHRGELDARTYQRLRVLAVRAPARLPADLRANSRLDLRTSATRELVEAFQWAVRHPDQGAEVRALLAPPDDDYTLSMDSTNIPLRVSYNPGQETYARTVMNAAETSWVKEVEEFGFYEPLREPGLGPYRMYVGDANGAAGYTSPYGDNPDTPWADCYTFIVIQTNLGSYARSTVAHELNHAMQAAMDCAEAITYWENTAVYVEQAVYPEAFNEALGWVPTFQAVPWRALDWFVRGEGYPYGGVVLNLYLADAFAGQEPGAVFIRRIWEASMQDDFQNSVSYFDGIEQAASARGTPVTMEQIFMDFSEARYFVSRQDDGAHIDGAGSWYNASLAVAAQHYVTGLPLGAEGQVAESRWPEQYGSNHVVINLPDGYDYPLRFQFDGGDAAADAAGIRWAARVLKVGNYQPTVAEDMTLDASDFTGELLVSPDNHAQLILVVANLGAPDYHPDDTVRIPRSYRYDVIPEIPGPTITAVDPGELEAGQQDAVLTITGEGFVAGRDFRVTFNDPDLELVDLISVKDTEVYVRVTVPRLTTPGPKAITVTNHGGQSTTAYDLLVVTAPPVEKKPSCGCRTGREAGGPLAAVVFWLLVLAWRRRRSHRR